MPRASKPSGAGRSRHVATARVVCAAIALAACGHSSHETKAQAVRSELRPRRETPADLPRVVNPWLLPRAAGASDYEKAIEDIGPYEPADRSDLASPYVNTNAHYWTDLVGVEWTRDVDIDFDGEPLDLDGDGSVATLRALLDPARSRAVTFALGQTGFVFDTRLHGNRNIGHEFGTRLTAVEKTDLVKFLESL